MINWSQIDTAFLDMDGTLLDLHFDNYFWQEYLPRRYAEIRRLPPGQARAELLGRIEALQGRLEWYCVDHWSEHLKIDVAAIKHEIRDLIDWRPGARLFLEDLQRRGIRRVLVTNAHHHSLSLKKQVTGIDRHVDRVLCSHDFGQPKEAPGFWESLARTEPFQPGRTLLVDDSIPVLENARRHGFGHLLAILAPDSRRPPRPRTGFAGIAHFEELQGNE